MRRIEALYMDEQRVARRLYEHKKMLPGDDKYNGWGFEQYLELCAKFHGYDTTGHKYGLDFKTWEMIEI